MKRGRIVATLAGAVVALLLPTSASAHAYLVKTTPAASVVLNAPPPNVSLTFDEAVEPRFAIISVTDAAARQETTAAVRRSPSDPDTLVVPLKKLPEGWYLVYWRAISVDGHPVQGAFTFAVGPNAGPPPQFTVPRVASTATSTPLVVLRWAVFLTTMVAIGLVVLRLLIARPLIRRVDGTTLRALTVASVVASLLGLVALPIYIEELSSIYSLRSFFDFGALVPLWRTTAFGRGFTDMWFCFILFSAASWFALWLDRPEREKRSFAEIAAVGGVLMAAVATLSVPGIAGHAAQTAPRSVALLLDWLHLISGSLWIGGLIGLLVLWRSLPAARRVAGLAVCVPRFSNVAFVSVMLLLSTGIGASVLHLPVVAALWQTAYGKVILLKSALLLAAMLLAAGNLLRTKPQLARASTELQLGEPAARLLRRLVSGEVLLAGGAVFAAALLSSLSPPPPSFAKEGGALARVGPGKVAATVNQAGYRLEVLVDPNRATAPNSFALELTRNGKPVTGADISLAFDMLDMVMPQQQYGLTETKPGMYSRPNAPALVMVGHWGLTFQITPRTGKPFTALIVDHATG